MAQASKTVGWYTRRDGRVRGPFSDGHIAQHILLGRIRLSDELSRDRTGWQPVSALPELIPEELSGMSGWDDYQRLVMARIRLDERVRERRQTNSRGQPPSGVERRRQPDRRCVDGNVEFFKYQLMGGMGTKPGDSHTPQPRSLRVFLLTALLAMLVVAWFGVPFN